MVSVALPRQHRFVMLSNRLIYPFSLSHTGIGTITNNNASIVIDFVVNIETTD